MGGLNKSQSRNDQQSRSFVDPNQIRFLDTLRSDAQQLASAQQDQIGGVANQLSGRLGGIGNQLLGGLQGAAQTFAPGAASSISGLLGLSADPIAQQLQQLAQPQALAGQDALQAIASGQQGSQLNLQSLLEPGAQIGGQLGALDEAIQRNLSSTLGTLGGSAALAGQTGGDRQAFFSSEAAGGAQRAFAGGAADILSSDLASRRGLAGTAAGLESAQLGRQLTAAQTLGGQQLSQFGQAGGILGGLLGQQAQGLQAAGGLGLQQQQQQIGAGQAGLGQLGNLFNLGLAPFGAQFSPLQNLSQIIGSPTVLNQSQGQSRSSGFGLSF